MADAKELVDSLCNYGALFFTGVPDSLLSKFSACLMQQKELDHIIAVNEGSAIGLAIGNYLATGAPSVVYMQNSGLGNIVNPITSLADPQVYAIPIFLVVGWRGEPGVHDEPQHVKQGQITLKQLEVLDIPYRVVSAESDLSVIVKQLWKQMIDRSGPVAIVVKKGALSGNWSIETPKNNYSMRREQAVEELISTLPENSFFVATTGKTGRELFELREKLQESQRDFLTVGGMGYASSIALAVARQRPNRLTVCLDGDGAFLMHMGASATIATQQPKCFLHVLLNNGAHESVGGQPTIGFEIDYAKLSAALGYKHYFYAENIGELQSILKTIDYGSLGASFLEIRLAQGSRKGLGRPKKTPIENKNSVMEYLKC